MIWIISGIEPEIIPPIYPSAAIRGQRGAAGGVAKNCLPSIVQTAFVRRCGWQLGIALVFGISGAIATVGDRSLAQSNIVPDSTLGNENSIVGRVV